LINIKLPKLTNIIVSGNPIQASLVKEIKTVPQAFKSLKNKEYFRVALWLEERLYSDSWKNDAKFEDRFTKLIERALAQNLLDDFIHAIKKLDKRKDHGIDLLAYELRALKPSDYLSSIDLLIEKEDQYQFYLNLMMEIKKLTHFDAQNLPLGTGQYLSILDRFDNERKKARIFSHLLQVFERFRLVNDFKVKITKKLDEILNVKNFDIILYSFIKIKDEPSLRDKFFPKILNLVESKDFDSYMSQVFLSLLDHHKNKLRTSKEQCQEILKKHKQIWVEYVKLVIKESKKEGWTLYYNLDNFALLAACIIMLNYPDAFKRPVGYESDLFHVLRDDEYYIYDHKMFDTNLRDSYMHYQRKSRLQQE
jgi:hypothetical protein